jgi:hypothetical protein
MRRFFVGLVFAVIAAGCHQAKKPFPANPRMEMNKLLGMADKSVLHTHDKTIKRSGSIWTVDGRTFTDPWECAVYI